MRGSAITLVAAVSMALAAGACSTRTELTYPPIDASRMAEADALIVEADYWQGASAPAGVIRGAGQGAGVGAGNYVAAALSAQGDAALVGLLLAPIGVPIAAMVGASMAHSKEEVDAAAAAFAKLNGDKVFMASLERRVLDAFGTKRPTRWTCTAAASRSDEPPCPDERLVASLTIRPAFHTIAAGRYSPEITILAEVHAIGVLTDRTAGGEASTIFEAKWTLREELGSYFELAANDAALMREKLERIMDRLARRIVEDAFLAPRAETAIQVRGPGARPPYFDVPDGAIVRTRQKIGIYSPATHARLFAVPVEFAADCYIEAVDGRPTGITFETLPPNDVVRVKAGPVSVDVVCEKYRGSANSKVFRGTVEFETRPGRNYEVTYRGAKPMTDPDLQALVDEAYGDN